MLELIRQLFEGELAGLEKGWLSIEEVEKSLGVSEDDSDQID